MAIRRDLSSLLTPSAGTSRSLSVVGTALRLESVPVVDLTCHECNRDTELELTASWSDEDAGTTVTWDEDQAQCSWCMHTFPSDQIHTAVAEQLSS